MNNKLHKAATAALFIYAFFAVISITLAEIFFILALLFWAADTVKNKKSLRRMFPAFIAVPAAVFAAVHFTAALAGIDVINSLKDFKKVYLILGFFAAYNYIKKPGKMNTAVNMLAAGASVTGIYAVFTGIKYRFILGDETFRASSFSGNHMHAGGMLMMSAIVLLVFFIQRIKKEKKPAPGVLIAGAGFLFSSAGLLFTFTRGSWLGALAGIFIVLIFSGKRYFLTGAAVILFSFILMKDTAFMKRAMESFNLVRNTSAMERVYMWKAGINMIKDRPLTGIGTANVGKIYPEYRMEQAVEENAGHLHNNIIQVGVINGIPGIFSLLWIFFSLWYFFGRKMRRPPNNDTGSAALCGMAVSTAFFINGFFEYNLFSSQVALLFWFLSGLSAGQEGEKKRGFAENDGIKRILVIRPGAIGDVLLTTPFIRALKKALPHAEIDYLTAPFAAPVLTENPNIKNIKLLIKNRLKNARPFVKMKDTIKFYGSVLNAEYDAVFDLFGNMRTAIISFLTFAPYRVGFNFRVRRYFYNIKVVPDPAPKYNVYYHMDLLKAVGIKDDGERLDFFAGVYDENFISRFLDKKGCAKKGSLIGINPAGTWPSKKWLPERFSALIKMIVDKTDKKVVVLWGPGEKEEAGRIAAGTGAPASRVFLAPETGLKGLYALIKNMSLLITNDGGPKHLSVAAGTPTITLFGPTNRVSWGPADESLHRVIAGRAECAPCDRTHCPGKGMECMKSIGVDEVFEKVSEIIK